MSSQTPVLNREVNQVDKLEELAKFFQPSTTEQEVVVDVFNRFRESQQERDRNYQYFDGRNLIDYINDSVKRFVTNVDERDFIEDWQARVHDPFTRTKLLAILGKVVNLLPAVEIINRGSEDSRRASILDNLYQYSEDTDDYDELLVFMLLEAMVKGTAVGFEGYEEKTRMVRNITNSDSGDDLTISEALETDRRLFGSIVPLEEFFPQSVGIRRIADMAYCFRRKVMSLEKFRMDFAMFSKAKLVESVKRAQGTDEQLPFYMDYVSDSIPDGKVEVVWYYNQDTDEYVILANGVWLNPIEGELISPLPWNHKKLPFWEIRYDVFGSDFFYGKSFPDRIKSQQDVLNVLHNMLLDQSFLTIFPPILTMGTDSIEDDFLRPGRRTQVDTNGLPISQAYQVLDMGTPGSFHQFIMSYTKQVLEESSIDPIQQGVAGQGDRTTATEIRVAAAGVISLLGLFSRFTRYGLKRKAILRSQNVLQFWTDPDSPVIPQILGEGSADEFNKAFNTFEIEDSILTSGKRGLRVIEMFADRNDRPTQAELVVRGQIAERRTGNNVEILAIDPEYLRKVQFDIKFVPNRKSEESKDIDRALEVNFQTTMNQIYPDLINREELAAELAEKFGRDPKKVLKPEIFQQEGGATAEAPVAGGEGLDRRPRGGVEALSQNLAKGANGDGGGLAIRNLLQG